MALLLSLVLLLAPTPVRVSATPENAMSGTDLAVLVKIVAADDNRELHVYLDSENYSTSTYRMLNLVSTKDERIFHRFVYPKLPAGHYTITAVLVTLDKGYRAVTVACRIGGEISCAQ